MPRMVHFEIPVDDAHRARDFYQSVFGWRIESPGEERYWLAIAGAEDEYGVDGALLDRSDLHGSPVLILGVESVDESVRRAEAEGGAVVSQKREVPGVGWSAYVRDSEGNVIGLFQSANPAG